MLNLQEGQLFDGQYELINLIDTGGFTEVWQAKYLVAGNIVALKVYPKLDEEGIRNIEEEYKRLFELQHSNLVNVLHFGRFNGYPYLVMRFYPGGNASRKIGSITEQDIAKCLCQIGGTLAYLHDNHFVHQDIKPNNFLLDQFGNYYLTDLGLSLKVRDTIRMYTQTTVKLDVIASIPTGITPPPYRAPELYDRGRSGKEPVKATDIWALGASLYEMITGEPPFGDLGGIIQKNDPTVNDLPKEYSRDLDRLLKDCLEADPAKRPTAAFLAKKADHYLENGSWLEEKEPPVKKGTNSILIVGLTILMMVVGVFAIKRIVVKDTPIPSYKDTIAEKIVDSPKQKIAFTEKKDSPIHILRDTPNTIVPHQQEKTYPPVTKNNPPVNSTPHDEVSVVDYPSVRTSPQSSCAPTITRITRDKNVMKITFHIASCSGRTVSLYGPGNDRSFYVRSGGRSYDLLSISKAGEEITIPSGGLYFTTVFPLPGSSAREIDILEGRNQLDRGTNFFNFKGISLK